MKILVIGGTGVIGRETAKQLIQSGNDVTICSRRADWDSNDGDVTVVRADRTDDSAFGSAFSGSSFDAVYDMAAFTAKDAAQTLRLFPSAGQFIVTSSTAVYQRPYRRLPVSEDMPMVTSSPDPYSVEKANMERYLYGEIEKGAPVTIIRPSQTFGKGSRTVGGIRQNYNIVHRIRMGRQLVMFGDGTAPWAWTFAPDMAKAFVGVLGKKQCIGECYNAMCDEMHVWDDLYRTFGNILGIAPKIIHIPSELLAMADLNRCLHLF